MSGGTLLDAMGETERYRAKAEECRQMAEKVLSPLDKEAWLKLAERRDRGFKP